MAKAKYFDSASVAEMNAVRKEMFALREHIYKKYQVDILDTDALSSLSIYEIVVQYDPAYNINFARNGEDAKSNDILIEQKATRVEGALTKTGKPRKNAGTDAAFQFHANGDLESPRYLFVARNKVDLSILRIYDISDKDNRTIILDHLLKERNEWHKKTNGDPIKMKRDVIVLPEKLLLEKLTIKDRKNINGCDIVIA